MQLSNTGFYKSLFSDGTPACLSGTITLADYQDVAVVGLVGSESDFVFRFQDSKVFAGRSGDKIVANYVYAEPFTFATNRSGDIIDLYINETPVALGQQWGLESGYNGVLIDITGDATMDYYVNSSKPAYSVTTSITTSSTSGNLTGYIANLSDYDFELYDAVSQADLITTSGVSGIIASNDSGAFVLTRSSSYTGGLMSIPVEFHTNFGVFTEDVVVSGEYSVSPVFTIELNGPSAVINNYFGNYSARVFSEIGDPSFTISLNHISGSGNYTQLSGFSGFASNNYSGLLSGSGLLYCVKSISGTGVSITGNDVRSILSTGSIFAYATGVFSKEYAVSCYGIGTGVGFTGNCSGVIDYTVTGSCISGYFDINENITGAPYNIFPTEQITATPATGAIYYNVPENEVTSDILYIGNQFMGIVFGFHYSSVSGLANYLNANTGIHKVTAAVSGANTVLLSNSQGYEGNYIILDVDNDNDGTMDVSGPYLQGGTDTAYVGTVYAPDSFTGNLSGRYINTGSYSVTDTGYLYASGQATYLVRNFYDTWNLKTGYDPYTQIDFNLLGLTGSTNYTNSGFGDSIFYAEVEYQNYTADMVDIVEFNITGYGKSQTIRITGAQ